MFALFFSLYYAMFTGSWTNYNLDSITTVVRAPLNTLGEFITSIFNNVNTPMVDFGTRVSSYGWIYFVSFILALITSIGIVVMAVKGVKKAFGIFFMGLR